MALGHSPLSETPLSAVPAAGSTAYTLVADAGSYALTGASASLLRALSLNAEAASYSLSGAAATFLRTTIALADAGSYTISGADAELIYSGPASTASALPGLPVLNSSPAPWHKRNDYLAAMIVGAGIAR